jgi:hypothetical protein
MPTMPESGCASRVTALSVEFVAKPQEAKRVEAAIPKAITGALQGVTGFAGCLVMISDQEMRLVTVVTLWAGADRAKRCKENLKWVNTLLAPYMDRCLRVQTLVAWLPALPMLAPETNVSERCSMMQEPSAEENVCRAQRI